MLWSCFYDVLFLLKKNNVIYKSYERFKKVEELAYALHAGKESQQKWLRLEYFCPII